MPIDGLWRNETITGVPVSLTAIAQTAQSLISYGHDQRILWYFRQRLDPASKRHLRNHCIIRGDGSYGSSAASTTISVGPAPVTQTPDTGQEVVIPDYTWTIIGTGIAVIVAVAIAVLLLKKR